MNKLTALTPLVALSVPAVLVLREMESTAQVSVKLINGGGHPLNL